MITTEQLTELIHKESNIDSILKQIPNTTFLDYINSLIESKNLVKAQLIKDSELDRNYGYQILDGKRTPSKDKVIMIALAMRISLQHTNNLLSLSNNGSLYPKVERDALIAIAINKQYSVMKTNELLYDYNHEILK